MSVRLTPRQWIIYVWRHKITHTCPDCRPGGLDSDSMSAHELACPRCGATIRARGGW